MTFDFDIACPNCGTTLHAMNEWVGKTAKCKGCQHQFTISGNSPAPPAKAPSSSVPVTGGDASHPSGNNMPRPWHYAKDGRQAGPVSESELQDLIASGKLQPSDLVWKQGMESWTSVQATSIQQPTVHASARPQQRASFVQALKLADLFLGKEREDTFQLIAGEKVLDDLTIRHQHFLIVQRGITRVRLTTHRVLYTATPVFSPAYWLLVVVFPLLLFYYVFRISRNQNVSMPLGSVDSVEKRYRPNWLLFILTTVAAFLAAFLCLATLSLATESVVLAWIAEIMMIGLAAPAVLVVLLKTRIVGIDVRSDNNQFRIRFSPGDLSFTEARFDSFVQRLCTEVHCAKTFGEQPEHSAP